MNFLTFQIFEFELPPVVKVYKTIMSILEWVKILTANHKNPYVTLICTHCDFFKEDDIELECAAFKVLKDMLKKVRISPEEIENAFK